MFRFSLRWLFLSLTSMLLQLEAASAQVNFYNAPAPGPVKPEDLPQRDDSYVADETESITSEESPTQAEETQNSSSTSSSTQTNPTTSEAPVFSETTDSGGIFWHFPVTFTSALRMGYDTNVLTSATDPIGSLYTNLASGMFYSFGGRRLQLEAKLGAGVTYYYSRPGSKIDYNAGLDFNAKYKVNPRLQLSVSNSSQFLPQPELSIVGGTNRVTNQYIYQNTNIEGLFIISPKFASVTSFQFTALYYLDEVQNENEGRVEETLSQSLQFLLLPKTVLVLEYRVNPIQYFTENLSSFGQFLLFGVNQTFNPRLTFTMRGGAEYRLLNNPVDGPGSSLGPYYESSLNYKFGPASSLIWNMRYGTEASGLVDVTQRQTFRVGLTAVHALTARITLNLGINYQYNYFDQPNVIPDFYENVWEVSLGARFQINRYLFLECGYRYITISAPEQPSREYDRQIIFLGGSIAI